jgi:periplasmic divalent cation tolerance protein
MVTTANKEEAKMIVQQLLTEKLIACANVVGPMTSFFWWKEEINEVDEFLIIMKSHKTLFKRILGIVRKIHSYHVPEIIALPVLDGLPNYLDWLSSSLSLVHGSE